MISSGYSRDEPLRAGEGGDDARAGERAPGSLQSRSRDGVAGQKSRLAWGEERGGTWGRKVGKVRIRKGSEILQGCWGLNSDGQ